MVSTRLSLSTLVALAGLAALAPEQATAWAPHIVTKGNKFFNSESGVEFRMKGMAYYPRPNGGELSQVSNYDWTTDDHEDVWSKHLEYMKDLGVNTIRLYSVDPSKSHDKFMCACSEAGIYVLVGMAAPCKDCAIQNVAPPACYPSSMFTRAQMVYNAFAVYDNTLGFSVGNENNLQDDSTLTAPCVKALLRDVRRYAMSCAGSLRAVPIGLDNADIMPREQWLQYYDCPVANDELTRAEWLGFNPYVECDPIGHKTYAQSSGLQNLMKTYATTGYSRPIMFGEFGCNKGDNTVQGYANQRTFYDAKWMNEEKEMADQVVGGNVFEFTTEIANLAGAKALTKDSDAGKYGIGFFQPDTCDHDKTKCNFIKYPEYDNLKRAYNGTKPSTLTMAQYTPSRTKILTCPPSMSTELPVMPDVETLQCSVTQPKCKGKSFNAFTKDAKKVVKLGTIVPASNAASTPDAEGASGGNSSPDSATDSDSNPTKSITSDAAGQHHEQQVMRMTLLATMIAALCCLQ